MPRLRYEEIARCAISPTRDAVISTCTNGTYTLAQVAKFDENGRTSNFYMKGAFHISGMDELVKFRDLLSDTIRMVEERRAMEEEEAWDLIEEEEAKAMQTPFKQ